jgi:hypothetical protein
LAKALAIRNVRRSARSAERLGDLVAVASRAHAPRETKTRTRAFLNQHLSFSIERKQSAATGVAG